MKRTLAFFLALVMMMTCLPLNARAATAPKYTSLQMDINWDHIETVGKQDFDGQACACYALAYCRTMLDGKVHEWHEYSNTKDENKASAQWGPAKYTSHKKKDKAVTFKKLYDELCNGNPTVAQVKKIGKSNIHYVTVVGFTGVTDLDTLSEENFLILDPGRNPHKIFNMSEKYELRKNPDDAYYRLYLDTTSATVSFTSELYAAPEEPPVVDDGKWPTPTDLRWGYTVEYEKDEYGTSTGEASFVPGRPTDISFYSEADGWHMVSLYKENGATDQRIYSGYVYGNDGYYADSFVAGMPDLETGDYYFTVYCAGSSGYEDSETATSEILHYTKPTARLATPTDLGWNGTVISYTNPSGMTHLGGYEVEWLYAETADVEPTNYGSAYNMLPEEGNFDLTYHCSSFSISRKPGYYYFKIRLLSNDTTRTCHSETSAMSPALYFDGTNYEVRPGYTPDVPPAVEDGKLGTPYDLQWGFSVAYNDQGGSRFESRSTDASWKIDPLNRGEEYEFNVYRENGAEDILVGSWNDSYAYSTVYKYENSAYAGTLDLETGDYYYTVMDFTWNDTWTDREVSDVAVSPVWHYTKPANKVGACTDLAWNWPTENLFTNDNFEGDIPTATWVYADDPNIEGYHVKWYYSETNGGARRYLYDSWIHWEGDNDALFSSYTYLGAGYYSFEVKALSKDISIACNSDYVMSDPIYFDGTTGTPVAPEAPHTHSFGDWSVTTAATCTAEGVKTRACDCGESETAAIPAIGHTEIIDAAVAATCTAEGKTEGKHCDLCNEVLTAQETIPATGHTEVVDAAVAPTCTAEGKTEGKHCSACNEVLTAQETVAANGHTEVIDAAVAATCTAEGKTEGKHCSACNEVLTAQETVPATGHTWDNGTVTTAPTATADGVKTYTCVNCGETKTESIPATGETVTMGDANGDSRINFKDAILVLQLASGRITADDVNTAAMDVNGDGRFNFKDAILMLQLASGRIDAFPV